MSDVKLFDAGGMTESDRRIHTPSGFARKNLNFVQEIGTLKSLKAHSCIRENLESFLFFAVLSGSGAVKTGGMVYEVRGGDCVFLDCRKHYEHISSEEDPWEIAWVHFNGNEAQSLFPLFQKGNKNQPVFRPQEGQQYYLKLLDNLKLLLDDKRIMAEVESSHILSRLVLDCLNCVVKEEEGDMVTPEELKASDFDNLRETVNEHMDEPGLMGTLAVQYGLEPERLNQIFSKKYGITLEDYILNRKFNRAKELLRFTIKQVSEIAAEAGFDSEDVFREMFLKQEEMMPEDYRKKWAQWIKS